MASPFPLFFVAAALSLLLAVLVAVASPTAQGRRLAFLLFTESLLNAMTGLHGTSDGALRAAALAGFNVAVAFSVLAIVWFLQTVNTPWKRLVTGPMFWVWGAWALASMTFGIVRPEWFEIDTTGRDIVQGVGGVIFLMALAMAIDQFRRSTPSTRRAHGWFLAAFGFRDLSLAIILPIFATSPEGGTINEAATFAMPLTFVVFYLLIAYAILRTSLFDIDLKIKFGISRGTVAAIIAGVALVGSELIERQLEIDQLWPAVFIGAAMSLAVKPLLRIGDRLADATMPRTQDTPEYRDRRATEIYGAAWASAMQDGKMTPREKASLAHLADSLGLSARQAKAIERTT